MENYFTGGRCRLAQRVLTQAEENHRREPHKILVKCFKNFVYPWLARRKKRQIPNGISKYSIHQSIYELFYNSPRKKVFNKEFVSSSYTSLKRRVTFKEFTPPVIIFSLATAQQILLILCSVRVSVVLRLHSDARQVLERLESPQFKLKLDLIESRWRSCLVHLQLTAELNVIFLALVRDGNISYP